MRHLRHPPQHPWRAFLVHCYRAARSRRGEGSAAGRTEVRVQRPIAPRRGFSGRSRRGRVQQLITPGSGCSSGLRRETRVHQPLAPRDEGRQRLVGAVRVPQRLAAGLVPASASASRMPTRLLAQASAATSGGRLRYAGRELPRWRSMRRDRGDGRCAGSGVRRRRGARRPWAQRAARRRLAPLKRGETDRRRRRHAGPARARGCGQRATVGVYVAEMSDEGVLSNLRAALGTRGPVARGVHASCVGRGSGRRIREPRNGSQGGRGAADAVREGRECGDEHVFVHRSSRCGWNG
jgi:hypothetical protein